MSIFENITEHFKAKKYFLIKDYVRDFYYLADLSVANYLFGGYCDYLRSDCLFNYNYFSSRGIENDLAHIKDSVILCKSLYIENKPLVMSDGLKKRLTEMKTEVLKGVDVQTRDKTPEELKDGRTVRLIGAYHSFDKAKADCKKMNEHAKKNGFCKPEEEVIIRHTGTKIPDDFKGKITSSPSFSI